MVRCFFVLLVTVLLCISCARPEKRAARYDVHACPICAQLTNGTCPYCMGSSQCMYCDGKKERQTVSPNIMENMNIKPFSYKEPCPYCKSSGVCTYCKGTGKCWACKGTAKVSDDWNCLVSKTAAEK